MEKVKVIQGGTQTIKLTIIHNGARVEVFQPWELVKKQNGILNLVKNLIR